VSRARRRVIFVGDDGQEHEVVQKYDRKTLVSTVPPRSTWLVEAYDPRGHLVAVLVAGELVFSVTTGAPAFVLLPEGLAGAMVTDGSVFPVGTTRPSFPVFCATCRTLYDLPAAGLHAKRGTKPGRPGGITLGVSDSA
jgi:hypothetical protein